MSGIAFILRQQGYADDLPAMRQMVDAMAHRGPDGVACWSQGPASFGQCVMHTTPESLYERYPVTDETKTLSILWDGRLDNRPEIADALKFSLADANVMSDPQLVLAAFKRWENQTSAHLLGDFAFVIWNAQTEKLFAARDRMGIIPLYYCESNGKLLLASEIKPLLRLLDRNPRPDEAMLIATLLGELREEDNHLSLFEGIRRLPAGHWMQADKRGLILSRYWAVDPDKQTRHSHPRDYAEQFKILFDQAVSSRCRSAFPVASLLSGGLDSSSVTALATPHASVLEAFTIYADDAQTDERYFARQVASSCGIALWEFKQQQRFDPLFGLEQILTQLEMPLVGVAHQTHGFDQLLQQRNCRVAINGHGADHLVDETGYLADVLIHRGLPAFIRETRQFAGWYGVNAWQIAQQVLEGMAPMPAKVLGKMLLRGLPPKWIRPRFRAELIRRVRQPRAPDALGSFAQRFSYASVFSPYFQMQLEMENKHACHAKRSAAFPFLDSRLIEFVLSVPWKMRCQNGERKWLLRKAMAGRLPEVVLQRKGKGNWTKSAEEALEPLGLNQTHGAASRLSDSLNRYVIPAATAKLISKDEVWSIISAGQWINCFFNNGGFDAIGKISQQKTLFAAKAALPR